MSALLPSSLLELVTDRNRLNEASGQLVTDRYQFESVRVRNQLMEADRREVAATPSGSDTSLVKRMRMAVTPAGSNARSASPQRILTPKRSQPLEKERRNATTTPKGSQPGFAQDAVRRTHSTIPCQVIVWSIALLLSACSPYATSRTAEPREIHTADYDLIIPAEQNLSRPSGKALLILFPCFPCDAAHTRSASKIPNEAVANGLAVLLMNFNRHIMMSEAEKEEVIGTIAKAVKEHGVDASNTFIGGFSSGGNVSVLLAKALLRSADPPVKLKGVFAVDSPLDLVLLYECSQRDLAKTTFPEHKGEARYIVAFLDSTLGTPTDNPANYERSAPLLNSAASVAPLKDLPIRFYTERDTAWWRANRDDSYEELNAYGLKRIHDTLVAVGNARSEFITTEGRGVQHGQRHPHAWSIVDEMDLIKWIGMHSD